MDEEIKSYFTAMESRLVAMESRLVKRLDDTEARFAEKLQDTEARVMEKLQDTEARFAEKLHDTETRLLSEFWKWGRASDQRVRRVETSDSTLADRLALAEERIFTLERKVAGSKE